MKIRETNATYEWKTHKIRQAINLTQQKINSGDIF